MNKGKYTIDTVQAIYKAISITGLDKNGIKAGGISKDTYYRWIKSKSDFSDGVAQAKRDFRDKALKNDHNLFLEAVEHFKRHLDGPVETWNRVITHPNGKKSYIKTTVNRAPSRWAIEAILFPPETQIDLQKESIPEAEVELMLKMMDFVTDSPENIQNKLKLMDTN